MKLTEKEIEELAEMCGYEARGGKCYLPKTNLLVEFGPLRYLHEIKQAFVNWCEERKVELAFFTEPIKNGYVMIHRFAEHTRTSAFDWDGPYTAEKESIATCRAILQAMEEVE